MRKPRPSKRAASGRSDRLMINFRDLRPAYEVIGHGHCTRADLIVAGFPEEHADALVMDLGHTLIRPEQWFWTDRGWWKDKGALHLEAMYNFCGGSFTDLSPCEQASLLEVELRQLVGTKAQGPMWRTDDGRDIDIVRYTHRRLVGEDWTMAPAHPESLALLVRNRARALTGKDIQFIGSAIPNSDDLRRIALEAVAEIVSDPGAEWDRRPEYYQFILTGFRKIKDFDKAALLEAWRIIGQEDYTRYLSHYWKHQSHDNEMLPPGLPDLIGRNGGKLTFFFVTQRASFGSFVSRFVRDYARPLGFNVILIQLSPEPKR